MLGMDIDLLFCTVAYGGKINTDLLHRHNCGRICEATRDMIQGFWHIMDVIQGVQFIPWVFYISLEGDALGSFRNSMVPTSIMYMVTYVIVCLKFRGIFMITLGSMQLHVSMLCMVYANLWHLQDQYSCSV